MKSHPSQSREVRGPGRQISIDLLALDLDTCGRCVGSLTNIETAIELLRPALKAIGTEVRVRKTLITSEEQARRHRFASSPTIRIDGRDIVLETRESECAACTDLCGCEEGTSCRVWPYRGQEHTEAPVELIVEALLQQVSGPEAREVAAPAYPGAPANLRRFFAGRARHDVAAAACCSPAEQAECCEAGEKASCCGVQNDSCGCH